MGTKVKGTQATRILTYVSNRKTPATATQISKGANVPVTSVYARLAEMVKTGAIQRGRTTKRNRVFSN